MFYSFALNLTADAKTFELGVYQLVRGYRLKAWRSVTQGKAA
jgi:hypothetical protein